MLNRNHPVRRACDHQFYHLLTLAPLGGPKNTRLFRRLRHSPMATRPRGNAASWLRTAPGPGVLRAQSTLEREALTGMGAHAWAPARRVPVPQLWARRARASAVTPVAHAARAAPWSVLIVWAKMALLLICVAVTDDITIFQKTFIGSICVCDSPVPGRWFTGSLGWPPFPYCL